MSDPLRLADQICFALYGATLAMNKAYKPLLAELGLTYPQYLAMLALWEADGVTVKALGERLHLDSGTLTPLLKRLEAAGLVERRRDAEDERQVRILLTESGRGLHDRAQIIPERILCASGLGLGELRRLKGELDALRRSLAGDAPLGEGA
ncbi:MAG TPA: MarR family transcriptional regulator [Alphaproteobacteria bacterium]|nr:MarR family transcriptional regulator [Alphaproteobacteria bacterium]